MTALAFLPGWCAAAALAAAHLRARRRLVLVARASHELRGPLGVARLLLGGVAGGEPGRLATIDLELARAGRALDDLAAAPRAGRAPDRPQRVDVTALARAYAPCWRALAAAHGAGFRLLAGDGPDGSEPAAVIPLRAAGRSSRRRAAPALRAPATAVVLPLPPSRGGAVAVVGDPLRIVQAVANLVANAAEHGGGIVRVRVRSTARGARIEVADDGPGLPAPIDSLARPRRGRRGHGLAIALAIAESHGGRVTSLPVARGARLALDLPAAPPAGRRR